MKVKEIWGWLADWHARAGGGTTKSSSRDMNKTLRTLLRFAGDIVEEAIVVDVEQIDQRAGRRIRQGSCTVRDESR